MATANSQKRNQRPGVPCPEKRRPLRRTIVPWLFLLPITVLSVLIILGPSLATILYSFTNWTGLGKPEYAGLDNYFAIMSDRLFKIAIVNNLKWMVFSSTIPIFLGLVGAWLVSTVRRRMVQMVYRILFFLPYVLATVVVAGIWINLFHPIHGIGALVASIPHFEWANISFLGNRNIVVWSIALAASWQQWGFHLVILLAAMQSIDPELYEVAKLEGANRVQQLIHVTLPNIRPTFVFLFLISITFSITIFDYVFLMTRKGGPGNYAWVLSTLVYDNVFQLFNVGYGTAIGITMALFGGIFISIYIILRKRGWEV